MKLRLFILIFSCCIAAMAKGQESTTTIEVLESDYLVGSEGKNWIINGTFQHEDATMRCDSAFLDHERNTLEAYGDVFIRQHDTLTVQSDRLEYDGNTTLAHLYDNIVLTDGQTVLTTDLLTYDMTAREGTYYQGGRIVNGADTLTSETGYYFVESKDSYFRKNAVVRTPDALIKSDTLRYNSESKIAYFYGPTTIEGEDDFIYAEDGTYNTATDQASFQKNAYYRSGNHLLRGNSLYYDRKQNFGRALGNVSIVDTVEQIILQGELGEYNKATETAFVTERARVMLITGQDTIGVDTTYMAADTLKTQLIPVPQVKEWIRLAHERHALGREEGDRLPGGFLGEPSPADTLANGLTGAPLNDSLAAGLPADSLARGMTGALPQDSLAAGLGAVPGDSLARDGLVRERSGMVPAPEKLSPVPSSGDSLAIADRLLEQDSVPQGRLAAEHAIADTIPVDRQGELPPDFIGPPPLKPSDYLSKAEADSLNRILARADSLRGLSDTAQVSADSVRVLFAFNRVRIFKSDLQAITDSLVYTSLDSVMRCFHSPVLWSEGSQMSGEFMTISLRNKKIDQFKLYRSAMILSEVETDSTKYNQMSGKEMTGTFRDGVLDQLLVEGNARTIYYVPEDSLRLLGVNYAENSRTILHFLDNKLESVDLLQDVEQVTYPLWDPQAVTHLAGFHWRSEERPRDPDDIFRRVDPTAPPVLSEAAGPRTLQSGTTGLPPGENQPEEEVLVPGDQEQQDQPEGEEAEQSPSPEEEFLPDTRPERLPDTPPGSVE